MKKVLALLLTLIMLFSFAACGAATPGGEEGNNPDADASLAKSWIEKKIEENDFFSFKYDGKNFKDFIGSWDKKVEDSENEDGNTVYTVTYEGEGVKVTADIILYKDFPAVDWVCNFENTASSDSKPITDIQALDTQYAMTGAKIQYAFGGNSDGHDFEPLTCDTATTKSFSMSSLNGRSSNGFMPFYDMYNEDGGIVVAIGWTGQWTASFAAADDSVKLTAGMTKTDIALHAGEKMRTPSIVITFFKGDHEEGHNVYRRMVNKYYTQKDESGEPITELPLTLNLWGSSGEDMLLSNIKKANSTDWPFEVMWVDAGWHGEKVSVDTYDNAWYYEAGNWYVNKSIYPNDLNPVTDELHSQGKKFLLWFEPERLMPNTQIEVEHPEYIMPASSAATFKLFNLADDEACDYLTQLIGNLMKDNGVDWYRQDFNCDPLSSWQYCDSLEGAHREGITEIKYITNLYRYWDGLKEICPGLLIDNCASGGRRLDIELMKRSSPLWRSDYYVSGANVETNTEAARNIAWNLSYWIPLSCGGSTSDGVDDSYEFRCQMGSGLTMGVNNTQNKEFWAEKMDEYFTCRKMMTYDYYVLAQGTGNTYAVKNAAYEYVSPEEGKGFIMAFRPYKSEEASVNCFLKGLDADASYTFTVTDNGETFELDGKTLMENGLEITLNQPKSSVLIYFNKK